MSADRRIFVVARRVIELDAGIADLVAVGDQLTETDGFLMAPTRRHLERVSDEFDQLFYELENFGRGYPNGKPLLRLAGDGTPGLRRAA
jgi:hypothetical protein